MPDRNNTHPPQNNSFRCFSAAETCQYVYYCLRCVAARQSSRHLAYMQGVRIKACGSFPPQIVLALTSSKTLGEAPALRRFAGTPKQNHPKISCSEVQAVRRRRTWFVLFRSGMLPETKRICLGTIPFGAFPRSNFRARYYRLSSDIPCGSTQNGRGGKAAAGPQAG